jgi:hypothetical protein
MSAPVPDAGTDPAGFVLAVADRAEGYAMHLRGPLMRAFFLANVALWRTIAANHLPVPGLFPPTCSGCAPVWIVDGQGDEPDEQVDPVWPCPDLRAAVAAAQAYQAGPGA